MTDILTLQQIEELIDGRQKKQTVSNYLNNPLMLGILLMTTIGYLYFDKQEYQDAKIMANTQIINEIQEAQNKQTALLLSVSNTVETLAGTVDKVSDKVENVSMSRFTNDDGESLEKEFSRRITELKESVRNDIGDLKRSQSKLSDDMDDLKFLKTQVENNTSELKSRSVFMNEVNQRLKDIENKIK